MNYISMTEKDLDIITSLYVKYYNENEGGSWTYEKAYKRIRQVLLTPNSLCLNRMMENIIQAF